MTVIGTMIWSGGVMGGSGKTILAGGATGTWTSGNDKRLARVMDNQGAITFDTGFFVLANGTFNNLGQMTISLDPVINSGGGVNQFNNSGTLNKNGSGTTTFSGVVFNNAGTLNAIGTVALNNSAFTQTGTINPRFSPGQVTLNTILPNTESSTINIELGGTDPGASYDQLISTGAATLRGTLNISLINGFVPANGDQFEILKFPSHTGYFDHITGLKLNDNLLFDADFTSTNVVLTAVDTRPNPIYSGTRLSSNGDAVFSISKVAGQDFVIEATSDLKLPVVWTPVFTNVNSGAAFDFIDKDQHNFPRRFFHAYLLP